MSAPRPLLTKCCRSTKHRGAMTRLSCAPWLLAATTAAPSSTSCSNRCGRSAMRSGRRVLLITEIFPPDIGGPATFISELGHALHRLGHQVTVVCTADTLDPSGDRQYPFRVRRVLRAGSLRNRLRLRAV